ncbi:MAG TPA: type II toxin-antitoxin system ParD family antitoxin [Acetobacteraceae bacterium]|jgi:antitoxin ParD1/3/4|nr:type II toxin-antitoxin system ParD family antitoxin [Acetobacteraceae bacterium]
MPARNVEVTERQDKMIEALVRSGRYQDADEVVRTGLRLVEAHEAEQAVRLKALREAVQVGIDDLAEGRSLDFDSIEDLQAHLATLVEEVVEAEHG